jgi:cyclic pyranopterin phosphate synthase
LLTDDEVVRLVRIGVERLGIREVRFTGGEPLLRRGLTGIVSRAAALRPRPELSLTTNGIGLARTAGALRDAGLDRVNVSLDTLRPDKFRQLARRERLGDVRFCLERGYELRFIEQMPLDAQHGWRRADMVTADEIIEGLNQEFTLAPEGPGVRGSAPAETFVVNGGPARVGVIGSVTRPFCGACDRVRLTADGQIRNCLFARDESDLRGPLRAGASDEQIAAQWARAVAAKLPGHGINDPTFLQPDRPMSAIGG